MDKKINIIQKHIPYRCPACESQKIGVERLRCPACNTAIEGQFELPPLMKLSSEEQQFIMFFIQAGGSLKEMAKIYRLSYPTVRNKLDDLIEKIRLLGISQSKPEENT